MNKLIQKNEIQNNFDMQIFKKEKFENFYKAKNDSLDFYILGVISSNNENSPSVILEKLLNENDSFKEINVYINSPGGSIAAGMTISNILQKQIEEGIKVNTHITGCACSIASVIALSGDLHLYNNSMFMIHLPATVSGGNRIKLQHDLENLGKMEEQLIDFYKQYTREDIDEKKLKEMLEKETWLDSKDISEIFNINITYEQNKFIAETQEDYINFSNRNEIGKNTCSNINKFIADNVLEKINNIIKKQ